MNRNLPHWARIFFVIWAGQAFSLVGSAVAQFAIIWWITMQTGSATVLTAAMLASTFPQALVGPVAGVLVDRWNRKAVMIAADLLIAASSLGLAALYLYSEPGVWVVYLVLAVRSVCSAFHWPAMTASMPLIVPEEHLTRTSGLIQGLQSAANLIGPALGAALLSVWPISAAILLDVVGAVVASLALLLVRIPSPPRTAEAAARGGFFEKMKEGFSVLSRDKGLVHLLAAATVFTLVYLPVGALFPLMTTRHFGGGTWHMGIVEVAFSVGMLAGSGAIGVWGTPRKVLTVVLSLVSMGLTLLVSGLLPSGGFIWFAVAAFLMGAGAPFFNAPFTALLQTRIDPAAQGRVFSLVGTIMVLATPAGLLVAGPTADVVGVPLWFAASGAVVALTGATCFFVPTIMKLEESQPGRQSL